MTQARRFGAEFLLTHEVTAIENHIGVIGVTLSDGSQARAHSAIIATGVSYRLLEASGAAELTGRGIYYGAAMSETSSVSGEHVYVIGAANSAGQAAIYLSNVARCVTMLVRGATLSASMSHYLAERIEATPNIDIRYRTTVEGVRGDGHLEEILLRDLQTGDVRAETAEALFVFIGAAPRTEWLGTSVARDERGFILTGPDVLSRAGSRVWREGRDPYLLETSIPGVFAAGDVRLGSAKRVATAVGEGATAVLSIWQYRAAKGL
jgi:thioredoxin reductase (NADPH)